MSNNFYPDKDYVYTALLILFVFFTLCLFATILAFPKTMGYILLITIASAAGWAVYYLVKCIIYFESE